MTVKLICAFVIIIGCGYVGIVMASGFDSRLIQIRELSEALRILEIEITLNNSVLCDAMCSAANARSGVIADIFHDAAESIEECGGTEIKEVWLGVIEKHKPRLCVGGDVIEIINSFSTFLGSGTRRSESDNIRAAGERLKLAEEEAMRRKASSFGLYRGLGFACGILITVLLL